MLAIADTKIRQDAHARWCLNDLHSAAGAEKRHQPANWLRLDATRDLMAEIDHSSDVRSVQTINGGTAPGTYVCKELVYVYAMWISPAFHLKVIRGATPYGASISTAGGAGGAERLNSPAGDFIASPVE